MKNFKNKSAFTLIEILLAVAALVILAGIVILAINPSKQLADTRNSQRQVDVNSILNATYQYAIDHNGNMPATITNSSTEICLNAACGGLIDLSVLTASGAYLVSIPHDPNVAASATGSGYVIVASSTTNRITVSAPQTENGKPVITVTR